MKELIIDPSIELERTLKELIIDFKIKVISNLDNEEILTNLYFTMKIYLSEAVVDEIINSILDKTSDRDIFRNIKLKELGI